LLAIVIGISKSLFNTDLISLSGDPVAFKILFNFFVDLPSSAKFFNEFTLIVLENMLYIILISSAACFRFFVYPYLRNLHGIK